MTELLPLSAGFAESEPVTIEVRGDTAAGAVVVRYLGDVIATHDYDGSGVIDLGQLPVGGYGVQLGDARTAVEVRTDPASRLRYGFAVDYSPERDLAGISDTVRRLHLTGVQFYDWAYRHADLHAGGEEYLDALQQPISLESVRQLIRAVQAAGARALGYAAVYAAGPDEWHQWKHAALLTATGEPYGLGDFLFLLDPASPDWLSHFGGELQTAVSSLGFDGFHLDQYGYPKRAVRPDGVIVDVADSFVTVIEAMRSALPDSTLVFNNVNDFPTWATASTSQDAVYIEVWPPHVTLDSLARVVTRARSVANGKPIVIAAYQHVYDSAPAAAADLATAFTMAALFSHGATQLLAGEADRILVDPYYVRNHVVESSTSELLKRWYDFLVEHDELLLDPAVVDVTGSLAGEYNADLDVSFANASVAETAMPGTVWRRITESRGRSIVHLINLFGQSNAEWDAVRATPGDPGDATLRVRRIGQAVPRVQVADPDREGFLIDVPVAVDGDYAVAQLPAFDVWQLVLVDPLIEEDAL